jgi:hypothetical protein
MTKKGEKNEQDCASVNGYAAKTDVIAWVTYLEHYLTAYVLLEFGSKMDGSQNIEELHNVTGKPELIGPSSYTGFSRGEMAILIPSHTAIEKSYPAGKIDNIFY